MKYIHNKTVFAQLFVIVLLVYSGAGISKENIFQRHFEGVIYYLSHEISRIRSESDISIIPDSVTDDMIKNARDYSVSMKSMSDRSFSENRKLFNECNFSSLSVGFEFVEKELIKLSHCKVKSCDLHDISKSRNKISTYSDFLYIDATLCLKLTANAES